MVLETPGKDTEEYHVPVNPARKFMGQNFYAIRT